MLSLPIALAPVDSKGGGGGVPRGEAAEGNAIVRHDNPLAGEGIFAGVTNCREAAVPVALGPLSLGCGKPHAEVTTAAGSGKGSCSTRGHSGASGEMEGVIPGETGRDVGARSVPPPEGGCRVLETRKRKGLARGRTILVAESPGQLGISGKVWDSAFVLCDYLAHARASALALQHTAFSPKLSSGSTRDAVDYAGNNGLVGLCAATRERSRGGGSLGGIDPKGLVGGRVEAAGDLVASCHHGARSHESCALGGCKKARLEQDTVSAGGRERGLLEGRRVLELGAGTGLVSMCCALLGASEVVATDFEVGADTQSHVRARMFLGVL